MGRPDQHRNEWGDDDAIGIVYDRPRRAWRRERHLYAALVLGLLSLILLAGSLAPFSPLGLVSGLALATTAGCMVATDRASEPRPQQAWLVAGVGAFAVSLFAFFFAS